MKAALLCLTAICASFAPVASGQPAGERVEGRLPQNPFAPAEAVDHVAVRLVTGQGGTPSTEQTVVARSGPWQRESTVRTNGSKSTEYFDFKRALSVTWVVRSDGDEFLRASQRVRGQEPPVYRERTGEAQQWAGDVCEVWSWKQVGPGGATSQSLSCVTEDGVELWEGYVGRDGAVREIFHAVSVERRSLSREEVWLPEEALDWDRWTAGATPGEVTSGHEVYLVGSGSNDSDVGLAVSRRGDWTRTQRSSSQNYRALSISHPHVSLHFAEGEERQLSLQRHFGPQDQIGGPPIPFTPARESTFLGRQCIWWDTMPGWHDASGSECRDTSTGAMLAAEGTGWAGRSTLNVQAASFSDSPPSEATFVPTREVFSWITD